MRASSAMCAGVAALVLLVMGVAIGFQSGIQTDAGSQKALRDLSGAATVAGSLVGIVATALLLGQAWRARAEPAAIPSTRQ